MGSIHKYSLTCTCAHLGGSQEGARARKSCRARLAGHCPLQQGTGGSPWASLTLHHFWREVS